MKFISVVVVVVVVIVVSEVKGLAVPQAFGNSAKDALQVKGQDPIL